jgi:DNA-binding protein H-NS
MAEPAPDPKLIDLLPAYETALKAEGRRPKGIASYMWVVGAFTAWAGQGVTPGAVTPDQIEAYREALVENGCKPIFTHQGGIYTTQGYKSGGYL